MAHNSSYKSRSPRRKGPQTAPEQEVVEAIFKGLWSLLSWIFGKAKGRGGKKAAQKAQVQRLIEGWEQVELYLLQEQGKILAVSEADKILDAALQLHGVEGETMGERLKRAADYFPYELYQQIWQAHKLRNALAHEVGVKISTQELIQAVSTFRSALYHLQILT